MKHTETAAGMWKARTTPTPGDLVEKVTYPGDDGGLLITPGSVVEAVFVPPSLTHTIILTFTNGSRVCVTGNATVTWTGKDSS